LKTGQKTFFVILNDFVRELHTNGTAEHWEQQRKMAASEQSRRRLNRKIKEEKIIHHCLNEGAIHG
jgi:hypothetical protein